MRRDVASDLLKSLTWELRDLDLGSTIDEVSGAIDPATFLRCYVGANKPLIVRGGAAHWPAVAKWGRTYLEEAAGDALVTVDVTPNGRGDAVTPIAGPNGEQQLCFCTPHQRRCSLAAFLELFYATKAAPRHRTHGATAAHAAQQGTGCAGAATAAAESAAAGTSTVPDGDAGRAASSPCDTGDRLAGSSEAAVAEVPYLSHQNSNLTRELPQLLPDVEAQLPWAAAAFGVQPDAVNLWIGDERAATTFHKDHYENIYAMVAGTKVFHLLPPCDAYRLSLTALPIADYKPSGPGGALEPVLRTAAGRTDGGAAAAKHGSCGDSSEEPGGDTGVSCSGGPGDTVIWSPVEPRPADPTAAAAAHPLFFDPALPPPLVATIGPGDVLYLPALWHHFVEQRGDPAHGDWVVAVNAWYDMRYGHTYAYFKLAESLAVEAGLAPRPLGVAPDGVDAASG